MAGTRADHRLLSTVTDQAETDVLKGLDQLRTEQLIEEATEGADIVYRFVHPLVQEVIYTEMGLARARTLHQRMGEALERGEAAVIDDPAHALAYHFSRAGGDDPRVVRYLAAAGRDALESRADREAERFLREATERVEAGAFTEEDTGVEILQLEEDLARVLQRLGEYGQAADHWKAAPGSETPRRYGSTGVRRSPYPSRPGTGRSRSGSTGNWRFRRASWARPK